MKKIITLIVLVLAIAPFGKPQQHLSLITANSFIRDFPDPDSIHWAGVYNHFDWQAGYMMFVLEKLWKATGDERYFNYIKRYVDQQVDENGNIPGFEPDALDHFLPGYAILFMVEQTCLEKYKKAATTLHDAFASYPRNSDGGFWHAGWAKHQMWVDGVFMGQIFMARYARVISKSPADFDEVTRQMKIILKHCQKPSGLLLHGWDESGSAVWAEKETGLASEVWSEGLGWYAVLIADVFDYLPGTHPDYAFLKDHLQRLCKGLKDCQDEKTGMWCQVVDKPDEPGNWNETSGTGMFLYLIHNSIINGYIPETEYEPAVNKAYSGIIKKARINPDGSVDITDCSSIGIMKDYEEYISQPKEINTFAGIASFILGTLRVETKNGLYTEAPVPVARKEKVSPFREK
jgi:rhamnogalacturonyl hydrolase YesR